LKPRDHLALSKQPQEVEETDPTKQGLKLRLMIVRNGKFGVEETDPTKQGLKHNAIALDSIVKRSRRDRSNKTRIETSDQSLTHGAVPGSKRPIQQNKD